MPNFSGKWTLQAQMQAIAAGNWTGLALPSLFSWGRNDEGQLGQNDVIRRSSPVQVGALGDWSQVSGGNEFSAAIKTNGTLWTWGNGNQGALGQNDVIARSSPVQVGALTDWSQVSAGQVAFCAAIKTNGTLWSWGQNTSGRLGLNDTANRSSPVQVGALTDWSQVSGGSTFCAAIKTNGTLWSWGYNNAGQLGQNNVINRSSPVQVGALTDWAQVSTGGGVGASCAVIKTNGTLWSWGYNGQGQLGQNDVVRRSSPVQVGALTDWSQVSSGNGFCAAIKTNGTLWAWGSNNNGQLGQGDVISRSSPVQVGALTDWSQVSISNATCAAIKTNGTLWTWGSNGAGALGQNIAVATDRSSPVQVGSLTTWSSISQGSSATHILAILNLTT
jgi:alpha-tubulin suppressor-like RCC1 family protein